MRLYFDLEINKLVQGPGVRSAITALAFKRGDSVPLEIIFQRGLTAETLEAGAVIHFGIKSAIGGDLLALAESFVEADDIYSGALSLNTSEIDTWLGAATSKSAVAELTISEDSGDTWSSSQTVPVTIHADVLTENEVDPQTISALQIIVAAANLTSRNALVRSSVAVSGTTPAVDAALRFTHDYTPDGDGLLFTSDGVKNYAEGEDRTALYHDDATWYLWHWDADGDLDYTATKASAATTPEGLTGWTVSLGSGDPTIAITDTQITLRSIDAAVAGKRKTLKVLSGTATLLTEGSETIDNAVDLALAATDLVELISDGENWIIL